MSWSKECSVWKYSSLFLSLLLYINWEEGLEIDISLDSASTICSVRTVHRGRKVKARLTSERSARPASFQESWGSPRVQVERCCPSGVLFLIGASYGDFRPQWHQQDSITKLQAPKRFPSLSVPLTLLLIK